MARTGRRRKPKPLRWDRPLVAIAGALRGEEANELVQVLLAEAGERGWRLVEYSMLAAARSGEPKVAGAITNMLPTDPLIAPLRAMGCPIARLGRLEHPDDEAIPAVLPDYVAAGRLAAEHFAERGFRNLALVGHELYEPLRRIHQGLSGRGEAFGCSCDVHRFTNSDRPSRGPQFGAGESARWRGLTQWLRGLPKPVGLLATDSWLAGTAIMLCRRAGLAVPEQVALLGVGNVSSMCELNPVPISAVDMPAGDRGRAAMRVLGEMMKGHTVPARTYVPPRGIVTRRSTDILAVGNVVVAQAIRFMWDHLDEDLSVDDVAQAVRTPRHTLQRLFRRYLERGIHQEMRRARLERFAGLLRSTDSTVEQLAPQVGFRTAAYVTLAFRKTFGLTPGQYRRRMVDTGTSKPSRRSSGS